MNTLRLLFAAAVLIQTCPAAQLAVSTYFKEGFTPAAIGADSQGNVYVAGSAVIDASSGATGAAVAKFDPAAHQYLYLAYLDSAASDQISAMAVDGAGNAYVAGSTTNPNFPVIGAGSLGTPPATSTDARSFVTKISPSGAVLFSTLIGGSTASTASGIALAPQGRILVSGLAAASGFPTTPGAYSVPDSNHHWFLMELDAAAKTVIFSATGIGGSSIVLDAAGSIYLAGSSPGTDYPTTPGAYQTTFTQGHYCYSLCQIGFNGGLQHVTKVDPAGSKLIFSTGINDPSGAAGSTTNTGLAVDTAGNVYVTGTLFEGSYPFTVPAPQRYNGYLTKLDPSGGSLLFSIPIGGAGVQLDSSGAVYAGGTTSSYSATAIGGPVTPLPPPAIFSWVPQPCWPNNIVAVSEAYVMKVDPAAGTIQDAQWIDGSAPGATGITLAGGKVWMTGVTPGADVPFTPGAIAPQGIGPSFVTGAYLTAADFSGGVNSGPAIACVLDAGNLTHAGAVAGFEVLSLFGANLGPASGVMATDGPVSSLGGVTVTFDGNPAQLLYVSSSQINLVVPPPAPPKNPGPLPPSTVMQITVNGTALQRQFPLTLSNLSLFADLSANVISCPQGAISANGFQPVALNADGSRNSCTNPAKFGSTVSFFAHGVGGVGSSPPQNLFDLQALAGACSTPVENVSLTNGFLYQVDVQLPGSGAPPCASSSTAESAFSIVLSRGGETVGPRIVPVLNAPIVNFGPGQPMPMIVWATR